VTPPPPPQASPSSQMEESEFDVVVLKKAFDGIGCNKKILVEIICSRPAARLLRSKSVFVPAPASLPSLVFRATYEQRFDAAFMDRLRSELSGGLEHLCLRMMSGARGLAEEGRNFTESPEALGRSPSLSLASLFPADSLRENWRSNPNLCIDILIDHNLAEVIDHIQSPPLTLSLP
jgi:hypothetical protein